MTVTKTTLNTFMWQAKNKLGMTVKGEILAANKTMVKIELSRQGLQLIKIKMKPRPLFSFSKQKIPSSMIALFTRQIATMLSAGIPIVQALGILAQAQTHPLMQTLLLQMKSDIESGLSFAKALNQHTTYFNEFYCHLVAAGEQSGTLEEMLNRIATYREKMASLKNKVKKALFYPATVISIALLITTGLLIFVVPKFNAVFTSFGAELPAPTLAVIALSSFIQHYWWIILAGIGLFLTGLIHFKTRSPNFAAYLDRWLLRLPLLGGILHKSSIARFARTLSTTFAAGLPLTDALQTVADSAGNIIYSHAILQMRTAITTGVSIHDAMQKTHLFPSMATQMVAVGEESGSLEIMLNKVADYYEEQVNYMIDNLSSLLEPLIMVILGVLIGGLVIAMYLPIFRMGNVIAGGGG